MKEPRIVIMIDGGVAEILVGEDRKDLLILDFDDFNEVATKEEEEYMDALMEADKFNEASEALSRLELGQSLIPEDCEG